MYMLSMFKVLQYYAKIYSGPWQWQSGRTLALSSDGWGFESSRHYWHREREIGRKMFAYIGYRHITCYTVQMHNIYHGYIKYNV
jgi:hypothetical protein